MSLNFSCLLQTPAVSGTRCHYQHQYFAFKFEIYSGLTQLMGRLLAMLSMEEEAGNDAIHRLADGLMVVVVVVEGRASKKGEAI